MNNQHFVSIASATIHAGGNTGMWDEEDGFFYDMLQLPGGHVQRLKVRSMVGLLPPCAVAVFEGEFRKKYPDIMERLNGFLQARPELMTFIHDPSKEGQSGPRTTADQVLEPGKVAAVVETEPHKAKEFRATLIENRCQISYRNTNKNTGKQTNKTTKERH